jgi:hypothetical protein
MLHMQHGIVPSVACAELVGRLTPISLPLFMAMNPGYIGITMNLRILMLLSLVCLLPSVEAASQTAQARLYCYSVRMDRGVAGFGGTLDLSTLDWSLPPNRELAPLFGDYSHGSGFSLNSPGFLEPIRGVIHLDAPVEIDLNQNGYADFFEVEQGISRSVTSGVYWAAANETGTVTATWTRAAGSRRGVCTLALVSAVFGTLGEFQHSFEIIEYRGELNYEPGLTIIDGLLALSRVDLDEETLGGRVSFLKSPHDPENELALSGGVWTNAMGQEHWYLPDLIFRHETNYFGYVEFSDGDLSTPQEDYWLWVISIDDPNDHNGNGIPDFSDVPVADPVRPELRVELVPDSVRLTVVGTVGATYALQEITNLSGSGWTTVRTITPTNEAEVVLLPRPEGEARFWRLSALVSGGS